MSSCLKAIFHVAFISMISFAVPAQTTAFKYQGSLSDGGSPANGSFQMRFKLFDASSAGNQIGSTLNDLSITATNGVFSVSLDFGTSALNGANRWIEIAVRRNAGETYVTLSPREQIASSPYAVRTLSAAQADTALDSQKLGGVNANQFVQTNDARLSDARNPLPNSANYIQNQNAGPQASSNFNISGNGIVGGNLGVGTSSPGSKLTVAGTIESTSGGVKFPNGTTQASAGLTTVSASSPLTGDGTAASPLGIQSPLLIRDNDRPTRQLVIWKPFHGQSLVVPAGKTLVLEWVSGFSNTSTSSVGYFQMNISQPSGAGSYTVYAVPGTWQDTGTTRSWIINTPTKGYVEAGQSITLFGAGSPSLFSVTVIGYYVDVP